MKMFIIKLSTIIDVQKFISTVSMFDCDVDIVSGRYIIDAKSIIGLLSLDLSKPLDLKIYNCTDEIEEKLKPFIVKV